MAIDKFNDFTFNHVNQVDDLYKTMTAAQVKTSFDSRGEELKAFINGLIDILNSIVDGASGADNIGATAITDLDGTTVQTLIESLRDKLKSITDESSGADFVNATEIPGLTGQTVQSLLESLKSYVDTYNTNHKASTSIDHDGRYRKILDSYTKTETDNLVAGVTLGQIPSNSLTEIKMANDMKKQAGGVAKYDDVGVIANLNTTDKANLVAAVNELVTASADVVTYSVYKLNVDANDIYTEIQHKRPNGTLISKSVLSGGTSPNYTTRTVTEYATDGTTIESTKVYTLSYDVNGNLISEVLA